jgi:dihydroorotase
MLNDERSQPYETWLIRGAHVADPASGLWERRDILVGGGRILEVARTVPSHRARRAGSGRCKFLNAEDLWVWPGLVDLHVHFREPGYTHKETLASGCRAALRGGYTSVVCEPNTSPPIDSPGLVTKLAARAREESPVRVFFKAAMTAGREGEEVADVEALARQDRVVALSDDGDPVVHPRIMEAVCRRAARVGLPLSPHCEDSPRSISAYDSGVSPGFEPGPVQHNEARYIDRDMRMARRWGCPVHFSHVSLEASLAVVRRVREECPAAPVTLECAPHHLLLSKEDYEPGSVPNVNPPLRGASDRRALQEALVAGDVDVIASDHAPHSEAEKEEGASGFIGLETSLALILTEFVHPGRIKPVDAANCMSFRPAEILGLPGGRVCAGQGADLTIIDPEEKWTVRSTQFASKSRNTPFEGRRLRGRVVGVMINGGLEFTRGCVQDRIEQNQE